MRHTSPIHAPRPIWRAYTCRCERCDLRWHWLASVCPGCGHGVIRMEPREVSLAEAG